MSCPTCGRPIEAFDTKCIHCGKPLIEGFYPSEEAKQESLDRIIREREQRAVESVNRPQGGWIIVMLSCLFLSYMYFFYWQDRKPFTLFLNKHDSIDVTWIQGPEKYWIAVAIYCLIGFVGIAIGLSQALKEEK